MHNEKMRGTFEMQQHFNGDQFILLNELQRELSHHIEELSIHVAEFWKFFDMPELNVSGTLNTSAEIG